jgi:glycosyltransferase involved in cell wall biosynthesis
MEALSCGTPVIAFRTGALSEIIQNGINGFLVNNEDEMVDAILNVDNINSETCYKIAKNKFSEERMAREYISLYQMLIS